MLGQRARSTSSKSTLDGLLNGSDPDQFNALDRLDLVLILLRKKTPLKSQPGCFFYPSLSLADPPDLSSQPHLSKDDHVRIDHFVFETGGHRSNDTEVNARLFHPHPAGNIEKDIMAEQVNPQSFVHHCHKKGDPVGIDSLGGPPGDSQSGWE